jgi:hypothetical protein
MFSSVYGMQGVVRSGRHEVGSGGAHDEGGMMMRISQRVLAVGTLGAALAVVPGGAVAASPPPKDGESGPGNGAGQAGPHNPGGAGQPSGNANGWDKNGKGVGNADAVSPPEQMPGGSDGDAGHGANQPGPYDPNGVGQPSGNGKSEDNNGKRPCAGCVGNADAKNPPGQMPGGSDGNAGYECDRNQGVGKTNPAHSGCGPGPSAPPEQPPKQPPGDGPPKQPPGGGPPEQPPAGGAPQQPAGATQPDAAPQADRAPEKEADAVLGKREERGAPGGDKAQEAPAGRPVKLEESAGHPFTGGGVLILLGLGVLALAVGAGTRWFGSRGGA